ncbi:MAG: NFACT family protein [Cyanobium sp. M30B3]|nr:MAG: NFACT family protein [Cyanobium sp. M30B3]
MAMARLQPMDLTSLRAALSEWRGLLLPSRFEKAQQGSSHSLQLGLRHLQGIQWLELCWQAEAARVHAIEPPPRQGEGSTLAQQLQHGLRGLALTSLEQPGWERVVDLGFARRPGEPLEKRLVIELMGRHSNLFLLDGDGRVVALARQVKASQSRLRPIGTGDLYLPPPPAAGEPPSTATGFVDWQRRLMLLPLPLERALRDAFQGISPALARQLVPEAWLEQPVHTLGEEQWHQLWQAWRSWLEVLEAERFGWHPSPTGYSCWAPPSQGALRGAASEDPPPQAPSRPGNCGGLPINHALATYYGEHLAARALQESRQQLRQRLGRLADQQARQVADQETLLAAAAGSDGLQRQADALLSQRQPGRQCIDDAQKLYRRARKLRRSVAAITPRLEQHRRHLAAIEASLTYLDQAESVELLEALRQELEELLGRSTRPGRRQRRALEAVRDTPSPLELATGSGVVVQVGRNHRQNEWISFRQARRGDLWFHAQELPGSHVVLKSSGAVAGDADLQAAADLAAHFSRGRANGRVPVVMVPVDALQRIPGAAPGTVRHRGGLVLWGVPERALSLLAAQQP